MRIFQRALVALALSLAASGTGLAEDLPQPFADSSRLVVVGGALLETVFALGEGGRVVARDSTGLYPPEAASLPDVGYMRALSPEGVLAQNPSALLIAEGSGPPEALAVLEHGSVPAIEVPESFSPAGVIAKVRHVGAALGVSDKAEALIATLEAQMGEAEALTRDIPEAERQKVLFVISAADGRIRAAGSGTAGGSIIGLAGGINPLADTQGYQTLTDEAILAAAPDAVVMMSNGGLGDFSADLAANTALAQSPAIRNGRILKFDGAMLLGFGPRTPEAIHALAAALYPDLVAAK
jgi:iron complex transport system substrate-binding protein